MKITSDYGNLIPKKTFTAGGTIVAGNPVVLALAGTVTAAGDEATAFIGVALNSAASTGDVDVVLADPSTVFTFPYVGTPEGVGCFRAIKLATGVYSVDMDDTDSDAVVVRSVDTATATCTVSFLPGVYQFGGAEVTA